MKKMTFKIRKIILTVTSGLCSGVLKLNIDWPDFINKIDFIIDHLLLKELIYDISIGVFTSMILIWFVDELSDKIIKEKQKKYEYETIARINSLIQLYISQYEKALYLLVTPVSIRNTGTIKIPETITIKSIVDLYKPTFSVDAGLTETTIASFFRVEKEVFEEFKSLTKHYIFEYYPGFLNPIDEFLKIFIAFEYRETILNATNTGNEKILNMINSELITVDDDFKNSLEDNGNNNNILYPYIALSKLLTDEYNVLLKYEKNIQNFF